MRIYKSIPKRLLALCLVFATGIGLGCLSDHFISENSRFQAFTDELFQSEVSNNTLTLHYTLANPSKKGIKKPEATLGTVLSDSDKTTNICQNMKKNCNPLPTPNSPRKTSLPVICSFSTSTPGHPLEKTAFWMSR